MIPRHYKRTVDGVTFTVSIALLQSPSRYQPAPWSMMISWPRRAEVTDKHLCHVASNVLPGVVMACPGVRRAQEVKAGYLSTQLHELQAPEQAYAHN